MISLSFPLECINVMLRSMMYSTLDTLCYVAGTSGAKRLPCIYCTRIPFHTSSRVCYCNTRCDRKGLSYMIRQETKNQDSGRADQAGDRSKANYAYQRTNLPKLGDAACNVIGFQCLML